MDHSFGYNHASTPDDFITREDLLWSLTDIVAKGGNLLLNVGPRGVDAGIPTPQAERLGWLAEFTGANAESLFDTRPWTIAEGTTELGAEIRYTASANAVHAIVRGPAEHPRSVRFADLDAATATSQGRPLPCSSGPQGTVVELDESLSPIMPLALSFPSARAASRAVAESESTALG